MLAKPQEVVKGVSMPVWPVLYRGADPFGQAVVPEMSSVEACRLLCRAKKEGLITHTSFHDDDLIPWDPNALMDVAADPKCKAAETLQEIKAILDEAGLKVNTATCNLHANPLFRRGGLTNPDPKIRELARFKVERTLYIGNMLGAKYFTYWVARDGFEVAWKVSWEEVYGWIIDALNHVYQYIQANHFAYTGGTIEPKPNEPRGHMFIPTAGHAVGLIAALEMPSFWGVNPELRQHEAMTLLDPITCLAYLLSLKKLFFLHFGNQINGQFDNDFVPFTGPEGEKETIQMFWLLQQFGWQGVIEFDCHAFRCELDPVHPLENKMQFIINCRQALDMALQIAERAKTDNLPEGESAADLAMAKRLYGLPE